MADSGKKRKRSAKGSSNDDGKSAKKSKTKGKGKGKKGKPDPEFDVEELRAKRVRNGKTEYLVKWLDYEEEDNTWEPEEHILGKELVPTLEKKVVSGPWSWQYYVEKPVDGKPVGWHTFEDDQGVSISAAYQAWCDGSAGSTTTINFSRTIMPGKQFQYTLDFEAMEQRNDTHRDHTVRKLRRVVLKPAAA